jgi:hypothetical protein
LGLRIKLVQEEILMLVVSRRTCCLLLLSISLLVCGYAQQTASPADPKPTATVSITDDDVELRGPEIADAANKIAKTDANKVTKTVRTFAVKSNTWLVPNDLVIQSIQNNKDFSGLDLVLVNDWQLAQVRVEVGYIDWTFDYTYKAIDQKRDILIASGKVTAFNGYLAAPEIADAVIEKMKKDREAQKQSSVSASAASTGKSD